MRQILPLHNVAAIKRIAALRAEPGRIGALFRFPTALVALVLRESCRLFGAALGAEFTLVDCSTGTLPTLFRRLGRTAFGTELSLSDRTAGALPALSSGSGRSRRLLCLLSHGEEIGCVGTAHRTGHTHAHKARHGACGVAGSNFHGVGLCGRHDAQLGAVGTDQTNFLIPDLLIELMI